MVTIKHKFRDFQNKKDIETLILGTFNPDTPENKAEFFYGREKNYLWNLLPKVFEYKALKKALINEKLEFINQYKIGFSDLIAEIQIEQGQETNYADDYIDNRVREWNDLDEIISNNKQLKSIFFTRKTFSDIPNMKIQIDGIKRICDKNGIIFNTLPTPARFENEKKLNEWKTIFNL